MTWAPLTIAAESEFVRQAKGAVEICRSSADLAQQGVRDASAAHGLVSPQWHQAMKDAADEVKKCAAEAKAHVVPAYKTQLSRTPELKPLIVDAYTAWLTQMDHLGASNQPSFDSSINRLSAELDAR